MQSKQDLLSERRRWEEEKSTLLARIMNQESAQQHETSRDHDTMAEMHEAMYREREAHEREKVCREGHEHEPTGLPGGGGGGRQVRELPPSHPLNPLKDIWAIARAHKQRSAQSAETKLARQWPGRPEVRLCHKE